ncbi:ATP-dependent Clp protease proteolytic subunit [Nitrospira sp. BLG_2]|uniref:ATP-dependent Clp protease proteolytic subunit n=1 Tax=Nitrospira sp. BLG_2 TaxID=3397507 RepID=UPI003B9BAD61
MLKKIEVDARIKVKNLADLIEAPIVIRLKKFNEESTDKFSEELSKAHETGQPIIPIVVDSYGGQVYSLLGMISEIQNCLLPVATIVESKAMSAGAILFGLGNDGLRFMTPHATLMLHEVSSFQFGKVEDLKADVDETDRLNTYIFDLLDKSCGQSKNYFLDLIHEEHGHADWYMTAKEAKKHNLCNQIRLPRFNVKVSVDYKFE